MKITVFILTLVFCLPAFAEGDPRVDLLWQMATKTEKREGILANTKDVVEDLRVEFNVSDEDLAFIHSIRAARLPYDGNDFFTNPKELAQLVTLYKEARGAWDAPILERKHFKVDEGMEYEVETEGDFYDFFPSYCGQRIGTTSNPWKQRYQTDHARKRFVMPK